MYKRESKLFASAGYDGYLRIFDIDKIELLFYLFLNNYKESLCRIQ